MTDREERVGGSADAARNDGIFRVPQEIRSGHSLSLPSGIGELELAQVAP